MKNQLVLPGLAVAIEPPQEAPAQASKREGNVLDVLLKMFDVVQENTHQANRACFNQLVRLLADCLRIHPLPEKDRAVAERLLPLAISYFETCFEDPWAWLGEVFERRNCANERLGQHVTPRSVVQFMVVSTMGQLPEDGTHPITVLDPCAGTGRFLVEVATRYKDKPLGLFGIEIDLDLYRAALVNMRTFAFGRPYFILRADALVLDARRGSSNWLLYGNLWNPPHWEKMQFIVAESQGEHKGHEQEH